MRAYDILRGVDVLAARPDVDPATIRAVARDVAGVWLLMAAAVDQRLSRVWIDRTPYSLRKALEGPIHKNLHAAIIPGFCLEWDIDDVRRLVAPRHVVWTDPTDWMENVVPIAGEFRYRGFGEGDERIVDEWSR
jgi:hypothetical protein